MSEPDLLEPQTREVFYRSAQEALWNISKHAGASSIQVSLTRSPEKVVLEIADDGRGFEITTGAKPSSGIEKMRERAAWIGAEIGIDSQPGRGTTITLVWRPPLVQSTVQQT